MGERSSYDVQLVEAEQVRPLRMRILRAGRPAPESVYPYDELPDTLHVAAVVDKQVVGCATVFPESLDGNPDAWRLRGMAVDEAWQGKGVGSAVMERVRHELVTRGVRLLWCNARTPAVSFYRRHGWDTVGEEFLAERGIPHYRAVLRLGETTSA